MEINQYRTEQIQGKEGLITEAGRTWFEANKAVVEKLVEMTEQLKSPSQAIGTTLEVQAGCQLSLLGSGDVSNVFALVQGNEKKIIKVRKNTPESELHGQSYLNEIKQVQAIKRDLGSELHRLSIDIPAYLLATDDLLATDFIDGKISTGEDLKMPSPSLIPRNRASLAKTMVDEYIARQRLTDKVTWPDGVKADAVNFPFILYENFIKKGDVLWWIDPIFVDRK